MNPIAQILWDAAADVEVRGVVRKPLNGETCAVVSIYQHRDSGPAMQLLRLALGTRGRIDDWNDAQPSRAVVAAALRDASHLADWAEDHLLKGES